MKKQCIISYASLGREDYPKAVTRMVASGIEHGHGVANEKVFLIVCPELGGKTMTYKNVSVAINANGPSGMPTHKDVPYAFKPWLFKAAFDAGYNQVLWCDSTIVIHKPLHQIWEIAEGVGACLFDNPGCPMRVWTSDDCMDKIGCPYKEPHEAMFNETMACSMAFDYSHPRGKACFDEWFAACNDGVSFAGRSGSTREEFRAHRHDQSVISWLAQKHGIPLIAYGTLVYNPDRKKFPGHLLANTGVYETIL